MQRSDVGPMSLTASSVRIRNRRRFLAGAVSACAVAPVTLGLAQAQTRTNGALTKEQRDRMTPGQVLDELKKGNDRFRSGKIVGVGRDQIRRRSPLLADLESKRSLVITAGMYNLTTGVVEFLAQE